MARQPLAEKMDLDDVTEFLARRRQLAHLRVRQRGSLLTLESGPTDDPIRHARFRRLSVHNWTLECATHPGRWQPTGERDTLDDLLQLLVTRYPWVLEPVV
jgi:hypothetical protein